jgi:hypothetical protein
MLSSIYVAHLCITAGQRTAWSGVFMLTALAILLIWFGLTP